MEDQDSDHINTGTLETEGGMPDAMIEGMEWPSNSGKSVVLIALRNQDVVPSFINAFLKTSQSSDISQSVSVLHSDNIRHDDKFSSYRIGTDVYHVGNLSWWIRLKLIFSEFPWLIPVGVIVFCSLMAALIRAILRRSARNRLQAND